MSKSNKNKGLTKEQSIIAAQKFGRHVSRTKAIVLFAAAILVCLSPVLMGIRFWDSIPEIVATGLTDVSGNDDPLPRWALVFAIPGLMTVLTVICHGQLYIHQKKQTLPPSSIRLLGRWAIPVLGLFFSSWAISSGAQTPPGSTFYAACGVGCILILLGSHIFDCKRNSSLQVNFGYAKAGENERILMNRSVGICSMVSGLVVIILLEQTGAVPLWGAVTAAVIFICPLAYCAIRH